MHTTDFASLVPWVINHGYLLFFIVAVIEGPLVTAAGGVAAALGYYNIYLIILLAVAGDVGGDFFYYSIGALSNKSIKSGRLNFLGITRKRVEYVEKLLHKRTGRAVLIVKLTPVLGPIGLLILGAVKAPFKKLIKVALSVAIPKSAIYALLGFYSAAAYVYLDRTISRGQNALLAVAAIALLIYLLVQKITALMAKKLEE